MRSLKMVGCPALLVFVCCGTMLAQSGSPVPTQAPAPVERSAPQPSQQYVPVYDRAIFQNTIAPDQLAFLAQAAGMPSGKVYKDKQFRKVLSAIPNPTFHYGIDMSVLDALDMVIKDSPDPVVVHDGRYAIVSGKMGPHHLGRGFVWVDLQEGIVLGVFYFRPNNGEPTPSITVISKQVKADTISITQLPPTFSADLKEWSRVMNVPPLETRYFIGDTHKKIVLEHDEDYCGANWVMPGTSAAGCEEMMADAADIDMVAASYLEQTHYATNATAYMLSDSGQIAWLQVRDRACGAGPDPLGCRIRMTHERTLVIQHRPIGHPPPHPLPPPPHR